MRAAATEPGLRDRVTRTLQRVERLYRLPTTPPDDDITGDMRRRRFAEERHNVWQKNVV